MSASNAFETALLLLIFNKTTIADLAENPIASPGPLDVLYLSLHTGDPGEAGSQNTSEATYGDYLRIAVNRDVTGFTVSGNTASNAAEVLFNQATGGTSNTLTHFGIGHSPTGAGTLYFSGALTQSLVVTAPIQPRFQAGQLTVTAD